MDVVTMLPNVGASASGGYALMYTWYSPGNNSFSVIVSGPFRINPTLSGSPCVVSSLSRLIRGLYRSSVTPRTKHVGTHGTLSAEHSHTSLKPHHTYGSSHLSYTFGSSLYPVVHSSAVPPQLRTLLGIMYRSRSDGRSPHWSTTRVWPSEGSMYTSKKAGSLALLRFKCSVCVPYPFTLTSTTCAPSVLEMPPSKPPSPSGTSWFACTEIAGVPSFTNLIVADGSSSPVTALSTWRPMSTSCPHHWVPSGMTLYACSIRVSPAGGCSLGCGTKEPVTAPERETAGPRWNMESMGVYETMRVPSSVSSTTKFKTCHQLPSLPLAPTVSEVTTPWEIWLEYRVTDAQDPSRNESGFRSNTWTKTPYVPTGSAPASDMASTPPPIVLLASPLSLRSSSTRNAPSAPPYSHTFSFPYQNT
mmetsp:Transcript_27910/g.57143  ORF Transcript_27910/g.57143 Transcript_27910/m.57143 type:complete len:417 (-) Transcript_27910:654-1904(-)